MLKRTVIALSVATFLIASVIGIGCSKAEEGQLQTYKVGDTWSYEESYEGSYYSVTYEVIGESVVDGRDCWVVKATCVPPLMGVSSATGKNDKTSLFPVLVQGSGSVMGVPITVSTEHSYQPTDASYFPLKVGKEVTVEETSKSTVTSFGEDEIVTETKTHYYKVEAVEEITVEAGTFKCFKITDGDATIWYSDKVKQEVKRIRDDGSVDRLTSYSV